MKKLLVLFTGGTISCKCERVMSASTDGGYRLIERYRAQTGDDTCFECHAPMEILSENQTLSTMQTLCDALWQTDFSLYRGIIITHGSDTLSYISALLALIFGGAGLPIVLTAANLPIEDARSNGPDNFAAAVTLVKSGLCGVYTVYGTDKKAAIYPGDAICEADRYFERFSPFGKPFGEICAGKVRIDNPPMFAQTTVAPMKFTKSILVLKNYPGTNYDAYNLESAAAVLHLLYHSGTACVCGESTDFLRFAERCRAEKVPLYVLPFRDAQADVYASAAAMRNSGVRSLPQMSTERAYAKLLIEQNGGVLREIDKSSV